MDFESIVVENFITFLQLIEFGFLYIEQFKTKTCHVTAKMYFIKRLNVYMKFNMFLREYLFVIITLLFRWFMFQLGHSPKLLVFSIHNSGAKNILK